MIQAKCIQKFRDRSNRIYGYRLQDINGSTQDVVPEQLKEAIKSGMIQVTNLVLTSDGRLVDGSVKQLQDNSIFSERPIPSNVIIGNEKFCEKLDKVVAGLAVELKGTLTNKVNTIQGTGTNISYDIVNLGKFNKEDKLKVNIEIMYGTAYNDAKRVTIVLNKEYSDGLEAPVVIKSFKMRSPLYTQNNINIIKNLVNIFLDAYDKFEIPKPLESDMGLEAFKSTSEGFNECIYRLRRIFDAINDIEEGSIKYDIASRIVENKEGKATLVQFNIELITGTILYLICTVHKTYIVDPKTKKRYTGAENIITYIEGLLR